MRAVDLFAGAGGFTEGATLAGVRVVWAANHCPRAVAAHAANHPATVHSCQDLRQADFTRLPAFDLLLASPACQGHSEASQPRRRPHHDADRATAWAVVDCLDACRPRLAVVENVPAFRRWVLFPVWRQALETLGYAVQELVLDAADRGVPQERRRLFVVAQLRRHVRRLDVAVAARRSIGEVLDHDAGGWAGVESKPPGVRARVELGRARFGRRFIVQQVSRGGRRPLDRPIGTITTARCHWHLVDGDAIRPLTVRELARAQGFRDSYALPPGIGLGTRLVGNAVPPPLAAAVITAAMEAA